MEPERKIEKLLRAYANKRRGDAGEPLKLHPATRRLLQGEVSRRAPKPEAEDASLSLWQLFRQQWAYLLGFALVAFLGATLMLPALSGAKHKAQSVSAISNLKQIGVAAQMAAEENNGRLPASLDTLTNGLVPGEILTDPVSGKLFTYVAGGENLDDLQSNDVLAYSPVDKDGRAVLFADGRVEYASRTRFSELTNQKSFQLTLVGRSVQASAGTVVAANGAAAPETSTESKLGLARDESKNVNLGAKAENLHDLTAKKSAIAGLEQQQAGSPAPASTETGSAGIAGNNVTSGGGELAVNSPAASPPAFPATAFNNRLATTQELFYRNILTQANSDRISLNSAATQVQTGAPGAQAFFENTSTPVLAHFEVQQSGDFIRILDGDGSVYEGSLLTVSSTAQGTIVSTETPAVPPAQKAEMVAITNAGSQQVAQSVSFRVAGMNHTLQQNVMFNGNLITISNALANAQQNFGGGGPARQLQQAIVSPQALLLSNSRIEGTAIVGDTNQIKVNAMPAAP